METTEKTVKIKIRRIKSLIKRIPVIGDIIIYVRRKHHVIMSYCNKENGIKKKSYGKINKDKFFYVLRCDDKHWGMFTMCFDFLLQLEWINKKGYIPVVDLKNYRPALMDNGDCNINIWEKMFLQPSQFDLEEVYSSKNVILGWKNGLYSKIADNIPDWNSLEGVNDENIKRWGKLFNQYINLIPDLKNKVIEFVNSNFKGRKVLGIAIREGYRSMILLDEREVHGHPILLAPEGSIELANQYMAKWDYDSVFVACDDEECSLKFKDYFGDKCILYERPRAVFFKDGVPVKDITAVHSGYNTFFERNMDYLMEIEILAYCNALIGGISSGIEAALYRNNGKYEHTEIYHNGNYQVK